MIKRVQGYLFELNKELVDYLFKIIRKTNGDKLVDSMLTVEKEDIEYIEKIEDENIEEVSTTEKEAIIKVRVGQGKFRDKLFKRADCCELCGLKLKELLYASYCKPWKACNNYERLDPNNGLLLCANHDKAFDKGYITFNESGNIVISDLISEEDMEILNIKENMKIIFNKEQIIYIKFHKENIFKTKLI